METSSVLRISRPSKTPSLLPYDKNFKWIRELRGAGATHKGGRMAGVEGLEPPTLGLETRLFLFIINRLYNTFNNISRFKVGRRGETRTPDPLLRRQMLY